MRLQNWLSVLLGLSLISSTGCGAQVSPSPKSSSFSSSSSLSPIGGAPRGTGGPASNARSGPATGGASGTVDSVSKSSFTMTTSAGVKVTVYEASSTKYKKGTSSTSVKAITKGKRVLVLGTASVSLSPTKTTGKSKSVPGTTSGTTIKATQVIVTTTGGGGSAKVIPFQPGTPTTSKQVGQIPANYTEGSGTIVSGTAANKATEAALFAYPGGVVDRVVKLSNGEYEVHNVGVSWPHHVFVSKNFKVVGAS
jgi:hypothetical protein